MSIDDDALVAARRLYSVALVLRLLGALLFGVTGAVGATVAVLVDGRAYRIAGAATLVGSLFAWLMLALLCSIGQAVSRYIEVRVQ